MTHKNENLFISTHYGYCQYTSDGLIYNLYIESIYRKQGLGTRLLKMAISELKLIYNGKIRIEAIPRENSISLEKLISFYKKHGLYVDNGETK